MTMGIIFKGINCFIQKEYIELIFEFFPMLIILWSLFGYMDILIIAKWTQPWNPSDAPSIITTMTNVMLKFGQPDQQAIISG